MEILFLFSISFIVYTYIGYPILLLFWSIIRQKKIDKRYPDTLPFVSFIIAARNEDSNIDKRITNLLTLDYPKDKQEVIIISDGSDDDTNNVVTNYKTKNQNISLLTHSPSMGKPYSLNRGVRQAKGEIIIFTDSRQWFHKKAVMELVANFADPCVGCASGELVFVDRNASSIQNEMGVYWHYEKIVRKLESKIGSVAGATGAIYAIRKALYRELPTETILDDVLTPMAIVLQGYRCVFDPAAIAYDVVSKNIKSEMTRKIRTLAGNWQLISLAPKLISPFQNKIWWRFISHKIFRLLVPFLMIFLFVINLFLTGPFYISLLLIQILFYGVAIFAYINPLIREKRLINLIYFFVNLNYAALIGCWYFFSGETLNIWKKN